MPVSKDSVSNTQCNYYNHSSTGHTTECSGIMQIFQARGVLSGLFLKVVILPQISNRVLFSY